MPLGTEVGLGPGHIVLDGDPAPAERALQPPSFRPMSIVAKRSTISATAELLFILLSVEDGLAGWDKNFRGGLGWVRNFVLGGLSFKQ